MSWALYDDLLASVPDTTVREGVVSPHWTFVATDSNAGLAMTPIEVLRRNALSGRIRGSALSDLARHVTSWNLQEATIAMAAINAHHNDVASLDAYCHLAVPSTPGLAQWLQLPALRKIAFIGHAPFLDDHKDDCELTILERIPRDDDLPDTACDFVLPEQDAVFITGTTLPNKTIVHLLDICRDAAPYVILWGPTVTLSPVLFDYGADVLIGHAVTAPDAVRASICEGGGTTDFREHLRPYTLAKDPGRLRRILGA